MIINFEKLIVRNKQILKSRELYKKLINVLYWIFRNLLKENTNCKI